MYDKSVALTVDPATEISLQVKKVDVPGVGLNLVLLRDAPDRFIHDGGRLLPEEIVPEDRDHQFLERRSIGDEDDEAEGAKPFVNEPERGGLDIRTFEVGLFQRRHQLRAIGLDGKLAIDAEQQLVESLGCHSAHRTRLSGIPDQFLAAEMDLTQFFEVRIFTAHPKDGNEPAVRMPGRQFAGEADRVQDLIDEVKMAR